MRVGDAQEKVCCQEPEWFELFKERLLNEVSGMNQASVQWHLAQMFGEITMSQAEKKRTVNSMLHNVETSGDWIVINLTLESLAKFARENVLNHDEFVSLLKKHQQSPYKSVASIANTLLRKFEHV